MSTGETLAPTLASSCVALQKQRQVPVAAGVAAVSLGTITCGAMAPMPRRRPASAWE